MFKLHGLPQFWRSDDDGRLWTLAIEYSTSLSPILLVSGVGSSELRKAVRSAYFRNVDGLDVTKRMPADRDILNNPYFRFWCGDLHQIQTSPILAYILRVRSAEPIDDLW